MQFHSISDGSWLPLLFPQQYKYNASLSPASGGFIDAEFGLEGKDGG